MLSQHLKWLPIALIAMAAVGCQPTPADDPLADHSVLSQQPCASPCWYGLMPDKSTEKDIDATLPKLAFVDPATISKRDSSWQGDSSAQEVVFDCAHPRGTNCGGTFVLLHDQLKEINLIVANSLSLGQVVSVLGQPDYFIRRPFSPEGLGNPGCVITLIWPQKGITVESIDSRNDSGCQTIKQTGQVDPNGKATQLSYISLEEFVDPTSYFPDEIAWPGFVGS